MKHVTHSTAQIYTLKRLRTSNTTRDKQRIIALKNSYIYKEIAFRIQNNNQPPAAANAINYIANMPHNNLTYSCRNTVDKLNNEQVTKSSSRSQNRPVHLFFSLLLKNKINQQIKIEK